MSRGFLAGMTILSTNLPRIKRCADKLPEDRKLTVACLAGVLFVECCRQDHATQWGLDSRKARPHIIVHYYVRSNAPLDLLVCVALGVDMVRLLGE